MANGKGFFDYFKNFHPSEEVEETLKAAENVRVRVAKDPLRIEVLVDFPYVVRNCLLYPLEDELCQLYEAASFRILPTPGRPLL